ncbi:MAG: hypothetical protein LBG97_03180 [Coriobacteriales bacterium]|jgi:hypothetical protein|nr:hypothetical protein [Coriobacteriales bacterium]
MKNVAVHPRVKTRHPEISNEDVLNAWENAIAFARRDGAADDLYVAAGFDNSGRLLEVVAAKGKGEDWLIFHAMKATQKTLSELGLIRR